MYLYVPNTTWSIRFKFIFGGEFYFKSVISLFICRIVVRSCSGYSSRGLLIKMDHLVVVDSMDVVSRLEATFVCLVPYD